MKHRKPGHKISIRNRVHKNKKAYEHLKRFFKKQDKKDNGE